MNRVTLVGNLGRKPEMKELADGVVVAKFSMATTEVYRLKDGEAKADTQWHTVVLWRSLARLAAEYLKKGSLVLVEGKLRYRSYEEEGVGVKYVTEIIADRLLMLDKRVIDRPVDNESLDFSDGHLPF
jgi:single-strand DNA-binding protein